MDNYLGFYNCKCGRNRWSYFAREDVYACGSCGRRVPSSDFYLYFEKSNPMKINMCSRWKFSNGGLSEKFNIGDVYVDGYKQSTYKCSCGKNLLIREFPIEVEIDGKFIVNKVYVCQKCNCIFIEESDRKLRNGFWYTELKNVMKSLDYFFTIVENDKKLTNTSSIATKRNEDVKGWKLCARSINCISPITKMRVTGTSQKYYIGSGNKQENHSFIPNMNNFYDSNYACPCCKQMMFKTVFPVGAEYPIQTDDGTVKMKRVFTCAKCHYFVTAANDLLSDGVVYENKFSNNNEYIKLLQDMNRKGTTQGRAD